MPYETHPACLLYTSSPDLNPIEKMLSKLKAFLRKEKIRMASELPSAISKGFLTIRPKMCIRDSDNPAREQRVCPCHSGEGKNDPFRREPRRRGDTR